jgi:F-type H+-transporting ATPase subunit delta
MNPALQGHAAAVVEDASADGSLALLASELGSVDQLFATNEPLRAAMTDTTVSGPARRAVLMDLLAGRVSDRARRAVAFAGSAVPAPEVPVALSWLAHRTRQAAEGSDEPEPLLGLIASRERIAGYAAAVFEELPPDSLEEIEDELFRFTRTVESAPALRAALSDSELPVPVRQGVVDDLLGGRALPATVRLVNYTLAGGRARDLVGTLYFLVEDTARARGWRVARVTSAAEFETSDRSRLSETLSQLAGQPVELQVTVDPALLAGVIVRVGDLQVDATARGRLDALREHMAGATWRDAGGFGSRQRPEGGAVDETGAGAGSPPGTDGTGSPTTGPEGAE